MTPQLITAIAYLIAEAAAAGVSIASILQEANATGRIPPERWQQVIGEISTAEDLWNRAGG